MIDSNIIIKGNNYKKCQFLNYQKSSNYYIIYYYINL